MPAQALDFVLQHLKATTQSALPPSKSPGPSHLPPTLYVSPDAMWISWSEIVERTARPLDIPLVHYRNRYF